MIKTDVQYPTVHLAIELSRSVWLVAARLPGVEKPSLHRIGGGDTAALAVPHEGGRLAVPGAGRLLEPGADLGRA